MVSAGSEVGLLPAVISAGVGPGMSQSLKQLRKLAL